MQESEVIGADLLSRLSYYLQRALVRISREAQRLAKSIGKCGKQEISSALKIVLSPACKYRLKFVKEWVANISKKLFTFADIAHMIGSFNFEQKKGFYTKIAKVMIWVEIG